MKLGRSLCRDHKTTCRPVWWIFVLSLGNPSLWPSLRQPDQTIQASGSTSSGSTGRPKGTLHTHANPYWTAELYGTRVLGLTERDICFSAAKLFFAYGLGNALSFPLSVGATTILMAERPTPEATFKRWRGEVGVVQRRSSPRSFSARQPDFPAGTPASPALPAKTDLMLRLASPAGEALPAELGSVLMRILVSKSSTASDQPKCCTDSSNAPGRVRYGTTGWPVPGYTVELRGEDGLPVAPNPDGSSEIGELYICGPSSARTGATGKSPETFQVPGPRAETSMCAMPMAATPTLVAAMTCSKSVEYTSRRSKSKSHSGAAFCGVGSRCYWCHRRRRVDQNQGFCRPQQGAQASADDLKTFVKERLAPYKYPRHIEFVSELPKTATGKIQRFKLREQELASR